jgi:acetyl esterase
MRLRHTLTTIVAAGLRHSGRVLDRIRGPVERHGHQLDPQVRAMLGALSVRPCITQFSPPDARAYMRSEAKNFDVPREDCDTEDLDLDGRAGPIPVRIYRPGGVGLVGPGLVFFHGGGFVIGDLEVYDAVLRRFANRARVTIVSVDYRLAPEYPFPAAVHDALDAWAAIWRRAEAFGIDRQRLAVGGDSAGGLLSAVVALHNRETQRPALQMLVYPATDFTRSAPSHQTLGDRFLLTTPILDWFTAHYAPPDLAHPDASPGFTDPTGVCPVEMIICGFDPLRDEAQAYQHALEAAGVRVHTTFLPGQIHGWLQGLGVLDVARHAWDALAERIGLALAQPAGSMPRPHPGDVDEP